MTEQQQSQQQRTWEETIRVEGGQLLDQVKKLINEGNVRRIVIKQGDRTVVEFPLTAGIAVVLIAPMLAAVGALAALLAECTIVVERSEPAGTGASGTAADSPPPADATPSTPAENSGPTI